MVRRLDRPDPVPMPVGAAWSPCDELLPQIQCFVARYSVYGTYRGAERGGTVVARTFLGDLDLAPFGTRTSALFLKALDKTTNDLQFKLPGREWGFARKG